MSNCLRLSKEARGGRGQISQTSDCSLYIFDWLFYKNLITWGILNQIAETTKGGDLGEYINPAHFLELIRMGKMLGGEFHNMSIKQSQGYTLLGGFGFLLHSFCFKSHLIKTCP